MQYAYNQIPSGRYFGVYQFTKPALIVNDVDLIKQITVKDFEHFTDHRTFIPENADPLWNKNLFALKDEEIVTLEMKGLFTRFTNDAIATTAFGVKVDSLAEPNNEFYLMGKEVTTFTFWRNLKFAGYVLFPKLYQIFKVKIINNKVGNFFRQVINDTIKIREERAIVRPDMIHLLMQARKGIEKHEKNGVIDTGFATAQESDLGKAKIPKDLTNEDITAQALIFFFAGFDTVSTGMSFAAYELAVNQDVQERLRKEVYDTLEECNGKLTYETVERVCTKPYTIKQVTAEEKPVHIEKGTIIWIPMFAIQRSPKYYPDPDRFDPERFNDENKENIKPYTYMPFGLGPRNCIGSRFALLEIKIVFFFILKHFELVPVEKTQIPLELSKKTFALSAANGFWLGLKRIKN
ncbi:hypothetical protein NQ314_019096 [Rhamnusium bicolor]|uniref:Cytochrome P450 n=1 Tax=Rhamnusium bicolor TaxID=1586634 RepID=A0AAV8WPZ6_9CUCU|nr:hypothetical protein NQ314_019096 [Rhamnusium bicolor]